MKDNKVVKFSKSIESTLDYVDLRCDEGDYVSALATLDYYASKPNADCDVFAHIADIYLEMKLYDLAIKYWLLYLTRAPKEFYSDGYNGLAANHYFLGNDELAQYYFNKQFECPDADGCVYNDIYEEFVEHVKSSGINRDFKLVEADDFNAEIELVDEYIDDGDFAKAVRVANKACKSADEDVRMHALCAKAFAQTCRGSESVRKTVIDIADCDGRVPTRYLTFTVDSLIMIDARQKAEELVEAFARKVDEERAVFEIFSAAHNLFGKERAKKILDSYGEAYPFSARVSYLRGALAYNDGSFETAKSYFKEGYYYSRSAAFTVLLSIVDEAIKRGKAIEPYGVMTYDSIYPEHYELQNVKNLMAIASGNQECFDALSDEEYNIMLEWATEKERGEDLPYAILDATFKFGDRTRLDALAKRLVDNDVLNEVKFAIVEGLCKAGYGGVLQCDICNVFVEVDITLPKLKTKKLRLFKDAYAILVKALMLFMQTDQTETIFHNLPMLQERLILNGNIDLLTKNNAGAIAGAVLSLTGVSPERLEFFCKAFNVDPNIVALVLRYALEK